MPKTLLNRNRRSVGQQYRLLQAHKSSVFIRLLQARNAARARTVAATIVPFLLLPSCSLGDPITDRDWRNEPVYVQVGEVVFELSPGRVYSLNGMKDKEINAALAEGKGTQASPLRLPNVRIGVPLTDTRGIDYDVSITEPRDVVGARNIVAIPDLTASLSSVDFNQSLERLSGKTYEGSAAFRFSNGQVIESPVGCHVVVIEGEIRNVFCTADSLGYRGILISLRANDGNSDAVANDFRRGLELISDITTK